MKTKEWEALKGKTVGEKEKWHVDERQRILRAGARHSLYPRVCSRKFEEGERSDCRKGPESDKGNRRTEREVVNKEYERRFETVSVLVCLLEFSQWE